MIPGHFATALVAYERERQGPLWFFLLAAMFLDFLMMFLVLLGIERLDFMPQEGVAAFTTATIWMVYSHDIVPVIFWAALFTGLGYWLTRSRSIALWGGFLVIFHEICDLFSGFSHNVLGPDTPVVGFGLYSSAPLWALAIELMLGLACIGWFAYKTELSALRTLGLAAALMIGLLPLLQLSI